MNCIDANSLVDFTNFIDGQLQLTQGQRVLLSLSVDGLATDPSIRKTYNGLTFL